MSFNLSKHGNLETGLTDLSTETQNLTQEVKNELSAPQNRQELPALNTDPDYSDNLTAEEQRIVDLLSAQEIVNQVSLSLEKMPPQLKGRVEALPAYQNVLGLAKLNPSSLNLGEDGWSRLRDIAKKNTKHEQTYNIIKNEISRLKQLIQQLPPSKLSPGINMAFNLKNHKTSQYQQPQSNFPIIDAADLANKFMRPLLSHNPQEFGIAADEILGVIAGEIQEEEVKSIIESLRQLNYETDQDQALSVFGKLYKILPEYLKTKEITMSNSAPKGIIKFNLSEHVLNNKKSEQVVGMTKTAADQFGHQYLLYGPTEKRICPKLRGKGGGQSGSGDIVSEYVCRHHCLDGIVIDDNKTICGEALWRANVMDKYSREYVNEDGDTVGGYINKRFTVERNVPEENKMRLKPGEIRKPRPAAWGNIESRMQDMRQKKAEERNYRPDSNTGDTFQWCTDVDQNNVEVDQKERERRETAMGHKLVQYDKKQANTQKFQKTSQTDMYWKQIENWETNNLDPIGNYIGPDLSELGFPYKRGEWVPVHQRYSAMLEWQHASTIKSKTMTEIMPEKVSSGKFNLKKYKESQIIPDDGFADGGEPYTDEEMDLFDKQICPTCGGEGQYLGVLGNLMHFRCRQCGMDYNKPNYTESSCKKHKVKDCKCMKKAQFGSIPLQQDGANADTFLKDPKYRKTKPMLGLDGKLDDPHDDYEDIGGFGDHGDYVNPEDDREDWHPDQDDDDLYDDPEYGVTKNENVLMPSGDILNKEEAIQRHLKDIGLKLMDFDSSERNAIHQVSNSWAVGAKVPVEIIDQAIEELQEITESSQGEMITPELQQEISDIIEKMKPHSSYKSSSKKFNLSKMSQMNMEDEKCDFALEKRINRKLSNQELIFKLKDLQEVIKIQDEANKEGTMRTPKLGCYFDQLHMVCEEMTRRKIPLDIHQKMSQSSPWWMKESNTETKKKTLS